MELKTEKTVVYYLYHLNLYGRLAQLVRASRLHRECRGFESLIAHHFCLRQNGERSRKASLHAASAALHSKPKFFFTFSPIPGSLACEVVSLRCRFIALVKPLISFAYEVADCRREDVLPLQRGVAA